MNTQMAAGPAQVLPSAMIVWSEHWPSRLAYPTQQPRAKEIGDGAPIHFSGEPRYFWWDNGTQCPPFLLRGNPQGGVDAYIEPGHEDNINYKSAGFVLDGWALEAYSARNLENKDIKEISEAEARSRRPAAFERPEQASPRYFYNGIDLYRWTGADTFRYWSGIHDGWRELVTTGAEILQMQEVTAQRAAEIFPEADIDTGNRIAEQAKFMSEWVCAGLELLKKQASITLPGSPEDYEVSVSQNPDNTTTFTLTVYPR